MRRLVAISALFGLALLAVTAVGQPPAAEKEKGRKPDPNLYRIFVNMDVGGFQSIVVDRNQFFVGQAVELTNDGRLVRVSGTALIKCKDAER